MESKLKRAVDGVGVDIMGRRSTQEAGETLR